MIVARQKKMLKKYVLLIVTFLFSENNLSTQAKAYSCTTPKYVVYMRNSFVDMAQKLQERLKLDPPNPVCSKLANISTSSLKFFCIPSRITRDSKKGRKKADQILNLAAEMMNYFAIHAPPCLAIGLDDQAHYRAVIDEANERLVENGQLNQSVARRIRGNLKALKDRLCFDVRDDEQFHAWITNSPIPVAVVYYSPSHEDHTDFADTVERMAKRMERKKIAVARLDADSFPFMIHALNLLDKIPSVLIYENGKEISDLRVARSDGGNRLRDLFGRLDV